MADVPNGELQWWLETRLADLATILSDLLGWAECPHPEPLTDSWLDGQRSAIDAAARLAIEAANATVADPQTVATIEASRRSGKAFARMLADDPALSTTMARHWPMDEDRRKYDDLAKLVRQIEEFQQAAHAAAVPQDHEPTEMVIQQQAAAVDLPPQDAATLDEALDGLKRTRLHIVRYLWDRRFAVNINEVIANCDAWKEKDEDDRPLPSSVAETCERIVAEQWLESLHKNVRSLTFETGENKTTIKLVGKRVGSNGQIIAH